MRPWPNLQVGCTLPTHNNPLFLRMALLQLEAQTRVPDVIAVFQNNQPSSYWWAVEDVAERLRSKGVEIINDVDTGRQFREPELHWIPLERLIEAGCDTFFKVDHDDFYYEKHIEHGIENLQGHDTKNLQGHDTKSLQRYDLAINTAAHELTLPFGSPYRFNYYQKFVGNPLEGMSNATCFNLAFAKEYLKRMKADKDCSPDDWYMYLLSQEGTFKVNKVTRNPTTCYVIHGSNSSSSLKALRRWVRSNVALVNEWLAEK